jgi:hypothetical protein
MITRKEQMSWVIELSVAELLAEPIVRMMMARAGVTDSEIGNLIAETRARIGFQRDRPVAGTCDDPDGSAMPHLGPKP